MKQIRFLGWDKTLPERVPPLLLENGRNLDGKSVAVGNEKLFMPLCRELSTLTLPDGKNLNVLNPSGEPMRGLRLFDLLSRLRNFLSDSRFEHARALIQHPDVLRRLAEEFALEENRILNLVDRCVIRHLPDQFNTVFQTAEPEVRPLFELLAKLRENGLRKSSLSELIHDWIRWVYSTGTPPPSHGIPLESETAALEEVLKIMQNSPLFRNAPLPECFGELLLRIAGRRLYRKREVHDFPVGGFLELPWSDAREIILCDGSPGVGCPVIASLSGAQLAVGVVEPTPSGRHDFARCQRQQISHQLQRLEQREKYLRQGAAKERTHKLCNIGGAVLHFWPEAQQLTKAEFYELLEHLAALPEVNEMFRQAMKFHHEHEGGG